MEAAGGLQQVKAFASAAIAAAGRMRQSQFELLPPTPGSVVFLGASIVENGLWSEWFPDELVYNRGIGGDTISGLSKRLEQAVIDPRVISVLVGSNDLAAWGELGDVDSIVLQFDALGARLRELAPNADIVVNGLPPRSPDLADAILAVNRRYAATAASIGAVYLDLWPALAGPDGGIRPQYSEDELHLTGAGYALWVDLLRPHVFPNARTPS